MYSEDRFGKLCFVIDWAPDGMSLMVRMGDVVNVTDLSKISQKTLGNRVKATSIPISLKIGDDQNLDTCGFSPCGNYIVAAVQNQNKNGILKFFSIQRNKEDSAKEVHEIFGHTAPINSISFSRCGKNFTTTSKDGLVGVWDTKSLLCISMGGNSSEIKRAIFSHDSALIASGGRDHKVDILSTKSGQCIGSIPVQCGIDEICWSPSSHCLAFAAGAFKYVESPDAEDDRSRQRHPPPPITLARIMVA